MLKQRTNEPDALFTSRWAPGSGKCEAQPRGSAVLLMPLTPPPIVRKIVYERRTSCEDQLEEELIVLAACFVIQAAPVGAGDDGVNERRRS